MFSFDEHFNIYSINENQFCIMNNNVWRSFLCFSQKGVAPLMYIDVFYLWNTKCIDILTKKKIIESSNLVPVVVLYYVILRCNEMDVCTCVCCQPYMYPKPVFLGGFLCVTKIVKTGKRCNFFLFQSFFSI